MVRPTMEEKKHIRLQLLEFDLTGAYAKPAGAPKSRPASLCLEGVINPEGDRMIKKAIDAASRLFGPYSNRERRGYRTDIIDVCKKTPGLDERTILTLLLCVENRADPQGFFTVKYPHAGQTLLLDSRVADHLLMGYGTDVDISHPVKSYMLLSNDPEIRYNTLFDGRVAIATLNSSEPANKAPKRHICDEATGQIYILGEGIRQYLSKNFGDDADHIDPHMLWDNPNLVFKEILEGRVVVVGLHKLFSGNGLQEGKEYSSRRYRDPHKFEHAATRRE